MSRPHAIPLAALVLAACHVDPTAGMHFTPPEPVPEAWHAPQPRAQVMVEPAQETPPDSPKEPAKEPQGEPAKPPAGGTPPKGDDAGAAPAPEAAADPVDEQRARDEVAFENEYLRVKERLIPESLGRWIAIAGGRALPEDAHGKIEPAATFEECVKAAEAAVPDALHRFVFRIGEEGDVLYADPARGERSAVGTALKSSLGILATFDPRAGALTWRRGEHSKTFPLEHDQIQLDLGDPTLRQSMATALADSSSYGGFVLLERRDASVLDCARFEIPGRVLLRTSDGIEELRRTRVRVRVKDLDLDATVPAAAWPK